MKKKKDGSYHWHAIYHIATQSAENSMQRAKETAGILQQRNYLRSRSAVIKNRRYNRPKISVVVFDFPLEGGRKM